MAIAPRAESSEKASPDHAAELASLDHSNNPLQQLLVWERRYQNRCQGAIRRYRD
jgi:hypothetical protein